MKYSVSRLQATLSTLFILCASAAGIGHQFAMADTIRWTGESQSSAQWSNPQNWEGGQLPGFEDVAVIPADKVSPVVDTPATVCGGLVLENSAKIVVQSNDDNPNISKIGLFVIGPGDLDGDGEPDRAEYDTYDKYPNNDADHDPDNDNLPNFADPDSDNDGLPDGCEYTYMGNIASPLNPFEYNDPDQDGDLDGFSDAEECAAGTNPRDSSSYPIVLSLSSITSIILFSLLLIVSGVYLMRRRIKSHGRYFCLLLLAIALIMMGYFNISAVLAADVAIDLKNAQTTIHGAVLTNSNGTLKINGDSVRPWTGESTYVVPVLSSDSPTLPPLSLQAVNGTVYIGGMRTSLKIGALGCGTIHCAGAYTAEEGHPMPLPVHEAVCFEELSCFLGERIQITAHADKRHRFHAWTGSASGTETTLNYQVTDTGQTVYALFGPPGPDLTPAPFNLESTTLKKGASIETTVSVSNIGGSAAEGAPWNDGLYLSRDTVFDSRDLLLATESHTNSVSSNGSYEAVYATTLPDVAPGEYYLLAVVDAGRNATDVNRGNNVSAINVLVLDTNLAQ